MSKHSNTGDDLSLKVRMQGMSFGQKLSYLWYYFKWPAIGVAAGALLLGFFIRDWIRAENTNVILNVTMVNAGQGMAEQSEFFTGFPARHGYDPDEVVEISDGFTIDLESMDTRSAQYYQIIAAEFVMGGIDVFVSDEEIFSRMAVNGSFLSLSELLDTETLSALGDCVWWYEDEETGETVPVGLRLADSPLHAEGIYDDGEVLMVGVGGRCGRTETASQLLEDLTG